MQYKGITLYAIKDIIKNIVDTRGFRYILARIKKQLDSEGFDIYCEISLFPFDDGIQECVDRATRFSVLCSLLVPHQAETFKQWFAELAEERLEGNSKPCTCC